MLRLEEKGIEAEALSRKPDITGYEWVVDAFWKLATCRTEGPIPWSAIDRFAVREGLTWEDSEDFEFWIMMMDREYLNYLEKKRGKHGR